MKFEMAAAMWILRRLIDQGIFLGVEDSSRRRDFRAICGLAAGFIARVGPEELSAESRMRHDGYVH